MRVVWPPDEPDTPWPFVRELVHLEVAESTNDVAKQLALEGRSDLPIAIWADRQTRGRGQRDRAWWSDDGSLTVSLLLDPRAHGLRTEHEPLLALTTAVAVVDTLISRCRLYAEIRWPNDIEFDGRKLGGILPERVETARGVHMVVGIGLNISTQLDDAPSEVRRMAVSVRDVMPETRKLPCHAELLRTLLGQIASSLDWLVRDDSGFASEWQTLNCLFNRPVRVDLGPRTVTGICRAIDRDGALVVETGGEPVRLFGGRVLRD